jgi:hypothetical protein
VQIDRDGTVNLIPVDIAVAEMLELSGLGASTLGQVFHITSESPVGVHDAIRITLDLLDVERFEAVGPEAKLSVADRMFNRSLKFYAPYFGQRKIFERNNVARHGADHHQLGYLLDLEPLREFVGHHLSKRRPARVDGVLGAVAPRFGFDTLLIPELALSR